MDSINITSFFSDFGAKILKAVEIDSKTSNQHEFNGVSKFKAGT